MGKASINGKGGKRRVIAFDLETLPFHTGRYPEPFLVAVYDGEQKSPEKREQIWTDLPSFMDWAKNQNADFYAHNGGKFDLQLLMRECELELLRPKIINGRIVKVTIGRANFRDSLALLPVALKQLGAKGEIAYWKFEKEWRAKYWNEIVEYALQDCRVLYDAVTAFQRIAGLKRDTIAATALAWCKKNVVDPGRTNGHHDAKFRQWYSGGRVEARRPGHHVSVELLDIKSAYPYAMTHEHASGHRLEKMGRYWRTLTRSQLDRCFLKVRCFSDNAFAVRKDNGLQFPSEYNTFHVTGWEFNVARDHDLLSRVEVLECWLPTETIDFQGYVDFWYRMKNEADKSQWEYTVAKIMLNSLYGKLAENPTKYKEYAYLPAGEGIPKEYENEGWEFYEWGEIYDIIWRPNQRAQDAEPEDEIFRNVATAASITGFTRAMLLDAMCRVGRDRVLYMDTDCLHVAGGTPLGVLRRDDALGAWEHEKTATAYHLAGKKLYAYTYEDSGETKTEVRSKGGKLSLADVKRVADGEAVTWHNDAPTFDRKGEYRFMHRTFRRTA